jgi:hypothetical protein
VLAGDVLELLRGVDELRDLLAVARRRELGGVARALPLDPRLVQSVVGGVAVELAHCLAQLRERFGRDLVRRGMGGAAAWAARGVLQPVE